MPTMVRSSPPIHVIQYGTRAHKGTLYKIGDKVVKINKAIHHVLRGLYFTYCVLVQGSTPHRLRVRASGVWPFWPSFRQKFALFQKMSFGTH